MRLIFFVKTIKQNNCNGGSKEDVNINYIYIDNLKEKQESLFTEKFALCCSSHSIFLIKKKFCIYCKNYIKFLHCKMFHKKISNLFFSVYQFLVIIYNPYLVKNKIIQLIHQGSKCTERNRTIFQFFQIMRNINSVCKIMTNTVPVHEIMVNTASIRSITKTYHYSSWKR